VPTLASSGQVWFWFYRNGAYQFYRYEPCGWGEHLPEVKTPRD